MGVIQITRVPAILCGFLLVLVFACNPKQDTNIPDVSDIDVDVDITRFEQLLLKDTSIDAVRLQQLRDQYPAFSQIFFEYIIPKPDDIITTDDPEQKLADLNSWIAHPKTRWLYDTIQQIYPDLKDLETQLTTAFKFAKYYFPEKETPKFYSTISDFGYFPFIYAEDSLRDGIGISLEMFAGEKFPYLLHTGLNNAFSDYLTRSYNKDHIVRRVLEVWLDDMMGLPNGNRLIDIMVFNGKRLYVMKSLMPEVHDSVIMDYPSEKLKWAINNERNIWTQFTADKLLYETSMNKIQKLIGPAPSSPGMPRESPGNTGSFIGWQIIKAFMQQHPEMTLKDLLTETDTQKILDESKYKPPR